MSYGILYLNSCEENTRSPRNTIQAGWLGFLSTELDRSRSPTMPTVVVCRRFVCSNAEHGYTLVGDTAQAILQGGSTFRFSAVRDMWFQEFLPDREPPQVHHMVENFR